MVKAEAVNGDRLSAHTTIKSRYRDLKFSLQEEHMFPVLLLMSHIGVF